MKVKIATAKSMLEDIYRDAGIDPEAVDWMVELALDMELEGNFFSGFEEKPNRTDKDLDPKLKESYEVDRPALKLINGNGKDARLVMKDLLPKAVKWTREQGQIFIGFKNCGYHASLSTIARKFAEQDLVCIYSSNGGPKGVVPYGGSKDVFGTNPVAYGIPTSGMPIVFDAATAERAWGTIRIAKERGEKLPPRTYLDKDGNYSTDPNTAIALIPFGGYKGYAFNLLFDVLDGALVGAKSGTLVGGEPDLGAVMILIDPTAFGSLEEFKKQTDQIVKDVQSNPPAEGYKEVRVPGYRGQELRLRQMTEGTIEVDDHVWDKFEAAHKKLLSSSN